MEKKTRITVSGILEDLRNGLTRTSNDKYYDEERGCIQEKYNLSTNDLKALFQHPMLKGKKTIRQKELSFVLIEDVEEEVTEVVEESTEEQASSDSIMHITTL